MSQEEKAKRIRGKSQRSSEEGKDALPLSSFLGLFAWLHAPSYW